VHGKAAHVTVLKLPAVEHVATPPGPYPARHATVTDCAVVPVMEFAPLWLAELAT